jgi:hypothetical protein
MIVLIAWALYFSILHLRHASPIVLPASWEIISICCVNHATNNVKLVLLILIRAVNVQCPKEFLVKIASVLPERWSIRSTEIALNVTINVPIAPCLTIIVTHVCRIVWFQRLSARVLQY